MSQENIDSISGNPSNQFSHEHMIPPLIANSPPPHLEAFEDGQLDSEFNSNSITEFNKTKQNLSDSNDSNSFNLSLPNVKSISFLDDTVVPVSDAVETDPSIDDKNEKQINLESFDTEWDAFGENVESTDNRNDPGVDFDPFNIQTSEEMSHETNEDASDWANFEQTIPSFNKPTEISFDNNLTVEQNVKTPNDNSKDEDDEWANFVGLEAKIEKKNVKNDLNSNLDIFLENIFKLYPGISLNKSGNDNLENDQFLINQDETWQQLQALTSTTDVSDSLQFKWNLSYLEDNYLDSLNLQRILPQVKIVHSFNTILQPVKLEPFKPPVDNLSDELPKTPTINTQNDYTDFESLKFSSIGTPSPQLSNFVSPQPSTLDIDLAFFEGVEKTPYNPSITPNVSKSKLDLENGASICMKNNQITGISSTKSSTKDLSSKAYLDSLLSDIFKNTNKPMQSNDGPNPTPSNLKKEDFFSDKKSLSSSTSSSLSNLSELSIQLAPQKLEMQTQQDLVQSNQTYDEKALRILSMLPPNATFSNSKILVFPMNQKQSYLK